MAYASLPDVQALNSARVYGATTRPASAQVGQWLDQTAAVIDSILIEKGYLLPVPTTASSALLLLQEVNALGAWAKVETGAEMSQSKDQAVAAWQSALAMLKAQNTVLDMVPKEQQRASPRGPGLTCPAGTVDQPFDPMFPRFDAYGKPVDNGRPLLTRAQQF